MADKEIKEAKSLRWLAVQFPKVENPKDDIDKMQNCINLYCTNAADLIDHQQAEIERLQGENLMLSQKRITFPERIELVNNARAEGIKEYKEQLISEIVNTPTKKYNSGVFYLDGVANRQKEIIDIIKGCESKETAGESQC